MICNDIIVRQRTKMVGRPAMGFHYVPLHSPALEPNEILFYFLTMVTVCFVI